MSYDLKYNFTINIKFLHSTNKKPSTIHQIIIMRLFFISFINHATNTLSAVVLRKFINVTTMLSLRHSLSSD